jgi:hypothetical protein
MNGAELRSTRKDMADGLTGGTIGATTTPLHTPALTLGHTHTLRLLHVRTLSTRTGRILTSPMKLSTKGRRHPLLR